MTTLLIFNVIMIAEISISVRIAQDLTFEQATAFDNRVKYCIASMLNAVAAYSLRFVSSQVDAFTSILTGASFTLGVVSSILCACAMLGMTDSIFTHTHNKS